MQIPVLNGIYTDGAADFRTSYPRNMVPVSKQQGISEGYLRPAEGIIELGTGPGVDRGGISWNGLLYRVMGTKLVKIDQSNQIFVLGDVGGTPSDLVTFDYSFDRLAVSSAGKLFYYDGELTQVVDDADLGAVVDFCWVDGYFLTTDGTSLIVTELNDPTQVNPLKYGSSEVDPDPVKAVLKLRDEIYAVNRYTVEAFQNIGGDFFPFARIDGAQLTRGSVGTRTVAVFLDSLVFIGGGRNESISVWLGSNGTTAKLSTREIDQILGQYSEGELSSSLIETRILDGHQFLYIHLAGQTLVYDGAMTQVVGEPVWFTLASSLNGPGRYKARNFVWCYGKWTCGDPTSPRHGALDKSTASHYGDTVGWEFGTTIVYNEGRGAIFHELELVCLTGRVDVNDDPTVWTSYTTDGETWSVEKPRSAGKVGERLKRLNWLQQGHMRNWRCQRFRGTSDAYISVARLEARVEALNV